MNRYLVVLALALGLAACAGGRPRSASAPATPAAPSAPSAPVGPAAPAAPAPTPAVVVVAAPTAVTAELPKPAAKKPPLATAPMPPAAATRRPPTVVVPVAPALPAASPAPAPSAAATPTLDLKSLEQRLRDTKAIGLFTKLALKNQVDDLLANFRAHHQGKPKPALGELRQNFDMLMLKVLSLLQDRDPTLAKAIVGSRESLWGILTDPAKLAAI